LVGNAGTRSSPRGRRGRRGRRRAYGRGESAANETVARIEKAGGQAFAVRAELGTAADVDTLFTGLERGLAGSPLDILDNNAAAVPGGPIETDTPEQFDHLFGVNVKETALNRLGRPKTSPTPSRLRRRPLDHRPVLNASGGIHLGLRG